MTALHLDLFTFEGDMRGQTLGVVDLLRMANTLAHLQHGAPVLSWQLLDTHAQPLHSADAALAGYLGAAPGAAAPARLQRACFVPAWHAPNVPAMRARARSLQALRMDLARRLARGETVLTLGNGALLVADCAQARQRRLAVPWFLAASLQRASPACVLDSASGWAEDGPLISAGLPGALPQALLALLRRALAPAFVQVCERVFVHDAERHAMTVQSAQQQLIPITRDSVLARATAWLDAHLEQPCRLDEVARAAAVSPRTLLRYFRQVMGLTPLQYLHRQRCKRACILLELTLDSVPTVARACGWSDPAAFRRVFLRQQGLPPSEYRAAHALRASRERWQVEGAGSPGRAG